MSRVGPSSPIRRAVAVVACALVVATGCAPEVDEDLDGALDERDIVLPPPGGVVAAFTHGHPVFVVHDDDGSVRVLDGVSPHVPEGFTKVVAWCAPAAQFVDLWHGSSFDREGHWLQGPAPTGLAAFDAEVRDGSVVVGERTEPPPRGSAPDGDMRAGTCLERTALISPGAVADPTVLDDLIVHEGDGAAAGLWYPTRARILGEVATHPPNADHETPGPPERAEPPRSPLLDDPWFEHWATSAGTRPHDVAPGPDGRVWYTGQRTGELGVLDPDTGHIDLIDLGDGAAPHGVIVADDGVAWVTDGGLNAIVAVDPESYALTTYPLPRPERANLNTATFAGDGTHWFTGQAGVHGRVNVSTGQVAVFDSPRGSGPYGIATTPDGDVWLSSLAGSYIARVLDDDGSLEVVDVPTPGGGARRVWSDSLGRLWVTEWFAGNLARYDPASGDWDVWRLPGDDPQPYAVFVDDADIVWVTDFGADALVRFDPATERFRSFDWPTPGAQVRQLLGRPGEVWGAGSATDAIIVLRTR